MIKFNELRITSDGKNLIIDVSVREDSYYENVYIDTIKIDNQNTFIKEGPSSKPVFSKIIDSNQKSIRLILEYRDILEGITNNILFIYITTKGTPSIDTPCGMDNSKVLGVTYNLYPLYRHILPYLKELGNTCVVPKNFIDFYLLMKALELSIATGNYIQAITIWNKYFLKLKNSTITNNCTCNG